MKCPKCSQELWETQKSTFQFKSPNEDNSWYQAVGIVYWCPDGCSFDEGCGYLTVELDD
jgi:hypothetical protein